MVFFCTEIFFLLQILYCNIGNPQSLGQQPITFFREVGPLQLIIWWGQLEKSLTIDVHLSLRFLHYVIIQPFWTKVKHRACSGSWGIFPINLFTNLPFCNILTNSRFDSYPSLLPSMGSRAMLITTSMQDSFGSIALLQ